MMVDSRRASFETCGLWDCFFFMGDSLGVSFFYVVLGHLFLKGDLLGAFFETWTLKKNF